MIFKKINWFGLFKFQGQVIGTGIWGIFWNPSNGRSWTIPKTISEINTSFSGLNYFISFYITTSFSY
jgi:hypothetical protein